MYIKLNLMVECKICGKQLRAFKNDWATRKYHKTCWTAQRDREAEMRSAVSEIDRLKNEMYLLMLSRPGQISVK